MNLKQLIESGKSPDYIIQEATFNSKSHIASFSDRRGSNADVYKRSKGYYVEVSGDVDYDMDAKDLKELKLKLKRDGFSYPPYSGNIEESEGTMSTGIGGKIHHMDGDDDDETLGEASVYLNQNGNGSSEDGYHDAGMWDKVTADKLARKWKGSVTADSNGKYLVIYKE